VPAIVRLRLLMPVSSHFNYYGLIVLPSCVDQDEEVNFVDMALRAAFEVVARDLSSSALGAATLSPLEPDPDVEGRTFGLVSWPGQYSVAVSHQIGGSPIDSVVEIAEQIQESVNMATLNSSSGLWPQCPLHPRQHCLTVQAGTNGAIWVCARLGREVAHVGKLHQSSA
jgi:hypothetical protein